MTDMVHEPSAAIAESASPAPSLARLSSSPTAYPSGWLAPTCMAMGVLGNATTYNDDLQRALSLNDFYAVGTTGGYILGEAFDAEEAIDRMPTWSKASKLDDRLQATMAEFQIAGGALKQGGENYSLSYVETGVKRYAAAITLLVATSRMFTSLADSYGFDCRGL
jgi:hypothetical protein